VHPGEGGCQPRVIVIIDDGASLTAAVAGDIGRVGQDESDASGVKALHGLDAIAVNDAVHGALRAMTAICCVAS